VVLPTVKALVELGVDLCVVATPTACHESAGAALARAGVPCLVEKPLSHDAGSAGRLVAAFEDAGVLGCVGHVERYNPALQALRDRLLAGDVGAPYQVATRRQGPLPDRVGDVGVVLDLATHDLDLTSWLCRSPYRTVTAHTAFQPGRVVEDLVAVVGRLADGTVTSHLANRLVPAKERVVTVTAERGCLVADALRRELYVQSAGAVVRLDVAAVEPLRAELAAFRDAVLGRPAPTVTLREGLAAVTVAHAVLDSACTGDSVKVDGPT
jgi:predicted dehydrogenase